MRFRIAVLVAIWLQALGASAQTISTIAGTGAAEFSGTDPQPAATATLYFPAGIAVDAAGNVYVADSSNHRLRKITPAGQISTLLGTGTGGGVDANSLSGPVAVAVDAAGNLYIADTLSNRIQKLPTGGGAATTIAGKLTAGAYEQGDPANGSATASPMRLPRGVAVDAAGNVYFSDSGNHVVRKVTPGGVISTVAGTFVAQGSGGCSLTELKLPRGLAITPSGDLFIADTGNNRVMLLSGSTMSVFAGPADCSAGVQDAAAASALFNSPSDVAVTSTNDVLIADTGNHRVRRVRFGVVTTIAGTVAGFSGDGDAATLAKLNMPRGIAALPGTETFFISDQFNHRVRKATPSAPTAPALDTLTPGNQRIDLAFTPAYDGGSAVTSFTATCTPGPFTAAQSASPITVTGLTNGTEYTCSVTATNALGTSSASNTKVATPGTPPALTSSAPPNGTVGVAYTHTYTGTGIPAPKFVVTTGPLPAGLALVDTTGVLSGTPTAAGTFTGTVSANNGILPSADQAFSITIAKGAQSITFAALPNRNLGTGPFTLSATGGASASPVVFASTTTGTCTTGGTNGATLTLVAGGTCTISASQAGDANYADAAAVQQSFTIVVAPSSLTLSTGTVAFGGQSMATTSPPLAVTVTNTGSSPLFVGNVTTGDSQFAATHDCGQVAASATCTVSIRFSPAIAAGALNAELPLSTNLSISSNAAGSPHAVALTGTAEKSLVTHYYRSILRRDPDSGGKSFWASEANRMAATLGANVNEAWFAMAQSFYFSAEYQAFNRNPTEFVTDLYNTFFNRPPDTAGRDFWVNNIGAGMPREVVLVSFMFSTEFANFTSAIFGNAAVRPERDAVMDFYRGFLGRPPDDGGFNFWVGRFRTAQCAGAGAVTSEADSISSQFVGGAEYAGRNRTNGQFVGDLYNSFLRRGGDLTGVNFWINQLNTAAQTREQVRVQFRNSPEFGARVTAIINAGCQS